MLNKTATVTVDQRFIFNASNDQFDAIVVSKGDVLKIKRHGIINKEDYVEIPNMHETNRILLDSALRDGWLKVNN